jgi:hypothetical protein
MRKLLKRWYVWLGLVLLLGLTGSVVLVLSSQNRITQANFDRIQDGMSENAVAVILGPPDPDDQRDTFRWPMSTWSSGPTRITVLFSGGTVLKKTIWHAGTWETLQWYTKKGAAKIGVKWD